MSLVPWSCSAEFRLPVADLARPDRALLPEHRLDRRCARRPCWRSSARRRGARCRRWTRAWRSCSGAHVSVDELVDSLLYEGYALYPYTPGATKNATPTPFGIVYPPAYARTLESTHDHLELQCMRRGRRRGHGRGALPAAERRAPPGRAAARSRAAASSSSASSSVRTALAETPAGGRPPAGVLPGREPHARRRPGSTAAAALALLADLHPPDPACDGRRAVRLPAGRAVRQREHVARARLARGRRDDRRRDRAPGSPADRARRAAATSSTTPRSRRRSSCTCTR